MSYWKSKVMPRIKKFFDKGKKKGAAEFCKNFDTTKESLDKEIVEKSSDLNPKVVEIYRSSSTFIAKKLLKEPKEATVKGNPDAVQGVLQELVKAGFPGAQVICDAGAKFGPTLLPGPVVYLFEKASVYLVEEPLPEEPKAETRELSVEDIKPTEVAPATEASREPPAVATSTEPDTSKDKPAATLASAVKEEKKEESKNEEPVAAPPPAAVGEAASAAATPAPPVVETPAESSAEPVPPPAPPAHKTD